MLPFLDPRFRRQQTAEERETAKEMLCKLWKRINYAEKEQSKDDSGSSDFNFDFDPEKELSNFLSQSNAPMDFSVSAADVDIKHVLDTFDPDFISPEQSVLKYWKSNEYTYPELFKLALIFYSVPPTEVQIERDFSRINYIFTDRRCALQSERLADIMIININSELFFQVKSDEPNKAFAEYEQENKEGEEEEEK